MNTQDLIIIFIALVGLIVFNQFENDRKKNIQSPDKNYRKKCAKKKKKKRIIKKEKMNYIDIDECIEKIKNHSGDMEFLDLQYHQDYNDTVTAINNLTPQKELFNLNLLPVKETIPDHQLVKQLVNIFIKKLNGNVMGNVSEYLHQNSGWSDMGKKIKKKSGFEEHMEDIGLPGSIYNEALSKAPIRLVKIDNGEQHTTDHQIRFIIWIIVRKKNAKDQMILRINFFMDRSDSDDRHNFFDKDLINNSFEKEVILEQVFIVGYLTKSGNKITRNDKFHDYGSNIYNSDGTIDQGKVLETMLKKHKERSNELDAFKSLLGEEEREKYTHPISHKLHKHQNTRTILDDYAFPPQKSFGDISI
jgi:hypothetical protein